MLASTDENMRHGKFSAGTREWFNVKNLLSLFDSAALWTNLPTSFLAVGRKPGWHPAG
jgi:hypothetical protein